MHFPTRAKITYFQDKQLAVELMYKHEDEWTKCFEVENIKLPSVTYLGCSAETGELADKVNIAGVGRPWELWKAQTLRAMREEGVLA